MERKQEVEEEEEESDTHNEAELKELEESIAANPQDSSLRFRLGLLLWEQGSDFKEKAAEQFVISAKLNPENAETFRFLGHYYDGVSGDVQRAKKCYQRAVTLNPDDSISGEALCDLLDQAGKESLELAVCNDASERSPRAFWAFRRLGFLNIHRGRISEAIQTLQHAIRGYPTCPDSWEALGLSYQRLGMYTAAIKAFGRAIELDESRIIALVESGNIFLMLGSFRKGIEHFQRALEISPQNVSANYGLASGLLGLAKECVNLGAFRWAASLLEDALNVAKANARLAGNLSSNWKLLGDIQLQYAKCFPWTEEDRSIESNVEIFKDSVLSWKRTCHSSAISARRSYQLALHLAPWQANLYFDIAITSDLISTFNENHEQEIEPWQLSEKMAFGALLLEGNNYEFWVALGCLSGQYSMRQHALIRALQLDVSLAAAWAYLGKLYREEAEMKLAKQAFDCARSIDPSLALPWAGMSADTRFGEAMLDEAFESCLRAVQISPLADFQIGLAKLALLSGNITSSQVLGAIRQAVERAPHHPESHNLKGLVCEARADYHAAISSYKLARFALKTSLEDLPKSHFRDVAINLARSLSKAGYYAETVQECESLKKAGIIDVEGLQIYAFSLSELGQNELARTVVRDLAARVLTMEWNAAATSVSLIFRLMYHISGKDSAISSIQKMPKELLQTPKVSFIVFAIHSLDQSNQLASAVSTSQYSISSHEEIIGMHYLISLSKLVKNRSENCLGFQSGILHLKKVLHMYPNSISLRNLLGHLLISSEEWKDNHLANKCCIMGGTYTASKEGLRTGCEILGAGSIACYTVGNKDPKFSFPTCGYQCSNEPQTVQELQRYLHQEPWNHNARYLLTLHLLQQAREERFPWNLCVILKRLLSIALSSEIYSRRHMSFQYQKFQLLLCASEISLQSGDLRGCLQHANGASLLPLPNNYLFFSHLLLCRAYAAEGNHTKLEEEYIKCLDLKTDYRIGWICLKMIECQYRLHSDANLLELSFEEGSKEWENSWNLWMAVFNLVLGLASLMNQDFVSAEESFARGCNLAGVDSCLHLCHGAACMELARKLSSSEFLTLAVRSLTKARANFVTPLPLVSLLLAQAEGSLGSKEKWEKNLRHEWYTWPPEMRPAELFFQMHLLARQSKARKDSVEFCQSPEKWVLRAIHMNPSGSRYWKVLYKLLNECQTMQGL